jgi:hypothetical protein
MNCLESEVTQPRVGKLSAIASYTFFYSIGLANPAPR